MDAKSLLNSLKPKSGPPPIFGEITYDELIFNTLKSSTSTLSASAEPKVLILCGPPGSGKSTIKNRLLESKNITDYVNIDPDEIRSILMRQGLTFPDDRTMSGITNAFNKRMSDQAQIQRFNIVFDTTGQNSMAIFALIKSLRASDYKTHFVVVYASLETCLARVNSRNARLAEIGSNRIQLPPDVAIGIYDGFMKEKGIASTFLLDFPPRLDEILLYDNNADGGEPTLLYQKVEKNVVFSSNFPNFYNMTLSEAPPYIIKTPPDVGAKGGKTKRIRRKKSKKTRKRRKYKKIEWILYRNNIFKY